MSKEMHEKIAGSQLVILPNSGHMTFVDQTTMFNDAVRSFLFPAAAASTPAAAKK